MPRIEKWPACEPIPPKWRFPMIAYHFRERGRFFYAIAVGEYFEGHAGFGDDLKKVRTFAKEQRQAFLDSGGRLGDI